MTRLSALAIATAVLAGGCSVTPTPAPATPGAVSLNVRNDTTLAVTIVINGQALGVVLPGGSTSGPALGPSGPPALPWTVEARSPSGRVLTTLTVGPGDVVPKAQSVARSWISPVAA